MPVFLSVLDQLKGAEARELAELSPSQRRDLISAFRQWAVVAETCNALDHLVRNGVLADERQADSAS